MKEKTRPWNFERLVWLCISLSMVTVLPCAEAQQTSYKRLTFPGNRHVLADSIRLPANYYSGDGDVVIATSGAACTLEFDAASIVEKIRFIVRKGAHLKARGALFRECQFVLDPGAEASFDSCGLDRCEFNGDPTQTITPASLRIINSIVHSGGWLVSMNHLGLEMMDSVIIDQRMRSMELRTQTNAASSFADLARRPAVRYTRFLNSFIHPSLLLTVSQVTFERCSGLFSGNRVLIGAGGTSPMVMLPVRWVNGTPEKLPPQIADGVGITLVEQPIAGGCSLTATVENGVLVMENMTQIAARPIQNFLPLSVAENSVPGSPASMPGTVPAAPSSAKELKLKQTHVNGLLVMPLATGLTAGEVTRMNMTAVPGNSNLRFSQSVGAEMMTALNEVRKYIFLRHEGLPANQDLEIAFEEKYSGKDGPSAAVACTLLVESLYTGQTWDPSFAVTGDMNADGSVQPIGGVSAKLRGATKGACKIVAIPAKNEKAVSDIIVMDGPSALVGIHVFGLETFEQAVSLASTQRATALQQAVDEFEVIRSVLLRDPRQMVAILRSQQAIARLQAILEKAPNSLSAKHLLLFAQGRTPTTLSIGGSLEGADANAMGLVSSIKNDFKGTVSTLKQDELGGTMNRLRNLRPRLDARVWPYVDALLDYGEIVRSEVLNPARTYAKFNEMATRARKAADIVASAKETLLADPQVREDLGL